MEQRLSSQGAGKEHVRRGMGTMGSCVLGQSPAAATFVASSAWLDSGVPVVTVSGDLDLTTASLLEEELLSLADQTTGAVMIDLTRCDFIDLRGLRVLLAVRERLARSDRPLVLVAGNPSLLRIFKITRVDDCFEIYSSLAAAQVNGHG